MKTNLLIVSHGSLASSLVATASLIFGEQQNVVAYGLEPGVQLDDFKEKIEAYIRERENENFLVLADLLFGSPFNSLIASMKQDNVYLVTGVNLPMVLEAAMQKDHLPFESLCDSAKEIGKTSITSKKDILSK